MMEYADPEVVEFPYKPKLLMLDDEHWELLEPFVAVVDGEKIVVPPGFVTDFDSVPKLPVIYVLLDGKGKKSAILHDFLYSREAPSELKARGRRWADRVFWAGMMAEGLGQEIADPKYAGVRLGGESHWEEAKA